MRRQAIERLKRECFDVLIIGGGINGAGTARDLALRARRGGSPLKIALVEQAHFSSGTSGKNSQLIHGGLRYLRNLEFRLVRQALEERAILLRNSPALVRAQPFLMPVNSLAERLFYGAGLALYDALAGRARVGGRHRSLSRRDLETVAPELAGTFSGALLFHDAQVHSARLTLANVLEAAQNGAAVANYLQAASWNRAGAFWQVELKDAISGEVLETRARTLVDCTGPWSRAGDLRLVRGSHIVVPRLTSGLHAIAWFEPSGRIFFVIPWGENADLSLVGTTDVDHDTGPDSVRISDQEVCFLLESLKKLFPRAVDTRLVSAFSSLRPLLRDEHSSAAGTSREHRIWRSPDGILHVAGGKYTTYRLMSEEAADEVARELAPELASLRLTATAPLALPEPADASVEGRVAHAVAAESAQRLADLMFVSTYWGYERRWDGAALQPLASRMGACLGWDQHRQREEIESVLWALAWPE